MFRVSRYQVYESSVCGIEESYEADRNVNGFQNNVTFPRSQFVLML
jgi:hypothetical protein